MIFFLLLVVLATTRAISPSGSPTSVTYDKRAFIINGTRHLLISGSVHYPRATPDEWPNIFRLTKMAGVDVIETYVFWNVHQPTSAQDWYFEGRADLWQFLQLAQNAGLFVNLRIGPYACAEWVLGGIPIWVKNIPGIVFRDDDEPWKNAMGTFVTRLVSEGMLRRIYAHQGGNVILQQIENEYGNVESAFKNPKAYVKWAADLALHLNGKEPWVMCQQDDAPNVTNIVNTCNGFYCDNWLPGHFATRNTPAAWTENWPGWFQDWGEAKPTRPVQDVAFSVARWFARGGSHMNYYMWFGGTNFDRSTGGPMIVTSYDYNVALNEFGLPHEPKYSQSAKLHQVLKTYERALLDNPVDAGKTLQNNVFVNVYGQLGNSNCVAFLSNIGVTDATASWNGHSYDIPAWSVSILGGCGATVTYNTATLPHATQQKQEWKVSAPVSGWSWWPEPRGIWSDNLAINSSAPLEQIKTTNDVTDYLWYSAKVPTAGSRLVLPARDVVYVFVDGQYKGTGVSSSGVSVSVSAAAGSTLAVLSQSVGLRNYGAHYEDIVDGLAAGQVTLDGRSITSVPGGWRQQVGLQGEQIKLWTSAGQNKVSWNPSANQGTNHQLAWWKATFTTPTGNGPVALNLEGAGKGFFYVNGQAGGRYWNITASGSCPSCATVNNDCDYRGSYNPSRCRCDCGLPSQSLYKVPRYWLKGAGQSNDLILIEELGITDFSKISVQQIQ